jgi:hypothetical protein
MSSPLGIGVRLARRGLEITALINVWDAYDYSGAAGPLIAQGKDTGVKLELRAGVKNVYGGRCEYELVPVVSGFKIKKKK